MFIMRLRRVVGAYISILTCDDDTIVSPLVTMEMMIHHPEPSSRHTEFNSPKDWTQAPVPPSR